MSRRREWHVQVCGRVFLCFGEMQRSREKRAEADAGVGFSRLSVNKCTSLDNPLRRRPWCSLSANNSVDVNERVLLSVDVREACDWWESRFGAVDIAVVGIACRGDSKWTACVVGASATNFTNSGAADTFSE